MKKLTLTLCILGTSLALAACETGTTYDSGSSYATGRTAGEVDRAPVQAAPETERVFRQSQSK